MNLAKQSTAKTFIVGPILDSAGAAKTDEVVGSIKVTKNGTVGAANGSTTLTHDHTGHYKLACATGDFDTLGEVEFTLNSGTNAMAPVKFQVVPANVYDSLVAGSDNLEVDTVKLSGTTQTARDIGASVLIADGSISSAKLASDCAWLSQAAYGTAQAGGATTITLAAGASSTDDYHKGALIYLRSGTGLNQTRLCVAYNGTTKVATVARAWATNPDATTVYNIVNLSDGLDTIAEIGTGSALTALATQASVDAIDDYIDTEVAAIKAKTDSLTFTTANKVDAKLTADGLDTALGNATAAAKLGKSADSMLTGTVDNTAHTPTTTVFECDDITEATADHYKNRVIIFTSGALVKQVCSITAYALTGGRGRFTVSTLTEAPANDDTLIIV